MVTDAIDQAATGVEATLPDGVLMSAELADYSEATELAHDLMEAGLSVRVWDAWREGSRVCWSVIRCRGAKPRRPRVKDSVSG